MSFSYRERSKLDNYTIEREWTFATAETFSDFLQEHDLTPDLGQKETSVEVRVGGGKTPEDIDAGTVLTTEIERLRKEAMEKAGKPLPNNETPPQPAFLEEVRRANIDAVMKAEYLKTPEDLKRIRSDINDHITGDDFVLEDFTEADALLVLRPFGSDQQTSTFAVCSIGSETPTFKDPVRIFSVEEAATRTGAMRHVTVHFEEVINPAYLPQGVAGGGKGESNGLG